MVAPITGPFTTEIGGSGEVEYYSRKVGWKQARPFTQPLPYTRLVGIRTLKAGSPPYDARSAGSVNWVDQLGGYTPLEGRVYAELKDRISSSANVAVNLAEFNQSLSMASSRLIQLYQFGTKLGRFDFVGAARVLRMATVPKRVSTKRSFANNYLEYHFGWAPLVGDIYNTIDLLQNPIKDSHIRVSKRDWVQRVDLSVPSKGTSPGSTYPYPDSWDNYRYVTGEKRVSMGVDVAINNPNLYLANQLGLVNPAVFIYEKIPFSFVADWFFNVEQFLSTGTDFLGLTLKNAWSTRSFRGHYIYMNHNTWHYTDSYGLHSGVTHNEAVMSMSSMVRQAGLIGPSFYARPWRPWGWRRTAAAASLIVQQLKRS